MEVSSQHCAALSGNSIGDARLESETSLIASFKRRAHWPGPSRMSSISVRFPVSTNFGGPVTVGFGRIYAYLRYMSFSYPGEVPASPRLDISQSKLYRSMQLCKSFSNKSDYLYPIIEMRHGCIEDVRLLSYYERLDPLSRVIIYTSYQEKRIIF